MDNFQKDMVSIASRSVCDATKDEEPGAYKPVKQIGPTVEVERIIYNYKAH